jgi:parallel beta-helix repeat protein
MKIYAKFTKSIIFLYIIFFFICTILTAGATINVPEDYTTIQQAISDAGIDEVIIVSGGPYYEHITVDKRLNIIGSGMPVIDGQEASGMNTVTLAAEGITFSGFSVTGGGSSAAGIAITADNVEVSNCTVSSNKGTGIEISNVDGVILQDNEIRDNVESTSTGIYVFSSTNAIIKNNTVANNNVFNLQLETSSYNHILNNTFNASGWHGIIISDSSQYNILSGNTIEETNYGHGIYIASSDNNVLRENTIRNNSPDYPSYAGTHVDAVLNLTFEDNILSGNNRHGIYLYECDDSVFSNNTITGTLKPDYADDSAGFYIYLSHENTIEDNIITDNEHKGLFLEDSRYNTLTGNIMNGNPYNFGVTSSYTPYFINYIDTSNLVDGKPIIYLLNELNPSINGTSNAGTVYCINCEGATVEGLTLSNNSYGIVFSNSVNSTIENNTVLSCEEGLFLISSHNNTITDNNASNNLDYGIRVKSSNFNRIYLNDFTDNSNKDYRSDSSVTLWRSPVELLYYFAGDQYTSYLGNHWGSYTGVDSDNDGIGDTFFTITNDNDDEYPLNSSKVSYSFAPNQPPSASFTYLPLFPDTDDTISFTDSSIDIDGSITAWLWNFGDGGSSSDQNSAHRYSGSGFYQVLLDVTDNQGATDNATCTIFVHEAGPMTIYVPDNFSTIQEAINISRDGDTVVVRQGTYPENVVVNRSITLTGEEMPLVTASEGNGFTVTSPDCTIEGFNLSDFDWDDYAGIKLLSDRNTVQNNVLYGNDIGIWLMSSDNNSIFNNNCTDNHYSGIQLTSSMNNTIYNNTCNNNSAYVGGESGDGYGIMLQDSGGNILYFNDIDNPNQLVPGTYYNAFDSNTSAIANQWFNATILKGNRYSDYSGEDGDNDGIGDSAYEIAYNSRDATLPSVDPYPLMPYGPLPEFEPMITGISTSDLTYNFINVSWSIYNDIISDNRVLYGTDPNLVGAQWSAWDNSTVSPHISLISLVQNTTYYYSCYSYNAEDTALVDNSSIRSFTTIQRENMILTVDDDDADVPTPPADYSSLAAALSAAIDGDTILVYNGTYMANHIVDKSVNITGVGQPELIGSDPDTYSELGNVVALEANDCILQGFRISEAHWTYPNINSRKNSACVRIDSDRNVVTNNILEDGVYGIYVSTGSNNNRITSNLLNDTYEGVLFDYARNNIFMENELTNIDHYPVMLARLDSMSYYPSTNNTIANNILSDTGYSWGIEVDGVSDNTIVNNTLSGENLIWIKGDRNSISGNSVQGPHDYHMAGIHLNSGEDNILLDNTVSWQRYGILLSPDSENVTMRNNVMEDNTYNFGFTGNWYYEGHTASTHDIDTSNTVDGKPIYYMVGEEDTVYSYSTLVPAPGYLACIDCRNITINDLYLEKNAQGLLLYNTTDSRIDGVTTIANGIYGMLLEETDNLIITDSSISGNGQAYGGIFLVESAGCLIDNCAITGNDEVGITLWYGCPDTVIRNSEITNNGDPLVPGSGIGIYISGSYAENVTVHSNVIANTHSGLQGSGIKIWAPNSTIYNNYFNNIPETDAFSAASGTCWNITPTPGTNIIGGPWIAGNFWSGYNGNDTDLDGLGDTLVPFDLNGEIHENGDYHPLLETFVPDEVAPVIELVSPVEGETYLPQLLYLLVSSPDKDVAYWWYSLNGNENVSFTPNTTLTNLPIGENTLVVYLNDTSGNENSATINFIVEEDNTPPIIHVISPENNTEYTSTRDISLEVWSPDTDVFSWRYSLDGGDNITFTPNSTLYDLGNGNHSLIIYVDDIVGNVNHSEVSFLVNVVEESSSSSRSGGSSRTGTLRIIDKEEDTDTVKYFSMPVTDFTDDSEEDEKPGYLTIITPKPEDTISRNVDVEYSSPVPLARVYYSIDFAHEESVTPEASIPVERLTMGQHVINVRGVDYYGNEYQGSVIFEVIPLAIDEVPVPGTPEFPDDVSYSFIGRPVNYTVSFEARNIEEGEISVYLNSYLSGTEDGAISITPSQDSGGLIYTPEASSDWEEFSFKIPANNVVPNAENLLSFIHNSNPLSSGTPDPWSIRNVILTSEGFLDYPRIQVFTTEHAFSSDTELMAWVDIQGVTEDHPCEGSIYLVDPDGNIISFPDGGSTIEPLDQSYLMNSHSGRIPGSLNFDESFKPGTYSLVSSLTSTETGMLESLSSTVIYYSDQPSVKLFTDRETYSLDMPVTVDLAITKGDNSEKKHVTSVLVRPDGSSLYLPYRTETFSSLEYETPQDEYMTIFEDVVTDDWDEGSYSVRSYVINESGYVLDEDIVLFDVCKEAATVSVRFKALDAMSVTSSNIRLIDDISFEVIASGIVTGPHNSVEMEVPVGSYWITGEIYTEDGKVFSIPLSDVNKVDVLCGELVTRGVSISEIPITGYVTEEEAIP